MKNFNRIVLSVVFVVFFGTVIADAKATTPQKIATLVDFVYNHSEMIEVFENGTQVQQGIECQYIMMDETKTQRTSHQDSLELYATVCLSVVLKGLQSGRSKATIPQEAVALVSFVHNHSEMVEVFESGTKTQQGTACMIALMDEGLKQKPALSLKISLLKLYSDVCFLAMLRNIQ